MLTDKNITCLAELVRLGAPKDTANLAADILKTLPGANWTIFAKLDEYPIEVQLWDAEEDINIDICILQKFKKKS